LQQPGADIGLQRLADLGACQVAPEPAPPLVRSAHPGAVRGRLPQGRRQDRQEPRKHDLRIASRYAELGGKRPAVSAGVLYALLDMLLQNALLKHLSNDDGAVPKLQEEIGRLLPTIC